MRGAKGPNINSLTLLASPQQNGHIEPFNSRLRDEFLNDRLVESLLEAQVLLEDWRREYNHERLHRSLCRLTPAEFKELWERQHRRLKISQSSVMGA